MVIGFEAPSKKKEAGVAPAFPFALPEKDSEKLFTEAARAQMAVLKKELEQLKKSGPPEPPFACGVAEGKIIDQSVFVRGNPEAKGEIVPKRFPLVLAGDRQPPITDGSGRLELASWLAEPGDPLPARVMVNRIWQWHLGEGIVRTPSNFGMAGERPTHPELLDYLAGQFVARGDRMHIHDLHATILHILGIDHERLTYPYGGRNFRLTDVAGSIAHKILV